jgi:protein-tyrosine-phosphatase
MAAAMMRHRVAEAGLPWEIDSAGLYAGAGQPMTDYATDALIRRHIVVQKHASKRVTPELIDTSDLILTMANSHREELIRQYPHAASKIHTLTSFVGEPECDVADPFGGSPEAYEACAASLEKMIDLAFTKLHTD